MSMAIQFKVIIGIVTEALDIPMAENLSDPPPRFEEETEAWLGTGKIQLRPDLESVV